MHGSQLGLIRFNTIESISAFASNVQNEGSWFACKLTPEQVSMVIGHSYSQQVFFRCDYQLLVSLALNVRPETKQDLTKKPHLNSAELRSHFLSLPSSFSQEFSRNWSVYAEHKYDQNSTEYETSQMCEKKKKVI